ncbi:MAG: glycosyltransferase family 9 protein [Deltaproteobacteria bacterium]|nr:glycosyltransferase family 9 protein [Deltaproteobacteria bacterium]
MSPSGRPDVDPAPGVWIRAVARLASWLLPAHDAQEPKPELARILIVRPDDRVGNALLTIPLARALQEALPHARIDLLLADKRAAVAEGLAGLHVVPFAKKDAFRAPLRFLRFLLALRRTGYDAALDAAHWHSFSLTSALLSRVASRHIVVGVERGPTSLYTRVAPLPFVGAREVPSKLELMTPLGLTPPSPPPLETALGRSPEAAREVQRALAPLGLTTFALLNPGSRKADHRLPAATYARIADALFHAHGLRSLVTWGPGEEPLAREVTQLAPAATLYAPPTDLHALAALLRACTLAITNDTGPMHLAVACGAKVAALFTSPDGARWSHDGPRFLALPTQGRTADALASQIAGFASERAR